MEKNCVRVSCKGNIGSGVLLSGEEDVYVLTAAHCLGDTQPNIEDVIIQRQLDYKSDFTSIKAVRFVDYNPDKDFALVLVEIDRSQIEQFKLGICILPEHEIKFYGYQSINSDQYRPFQAKVVTTTANDEMFRITLSDGDKFQQSGELGQHIARGLSGSGIFIKRHNSPFLVGIVNSVVSDRAWNEDIDCCAAKNILKHIREHINLSDIEYLIRWNENIDIVWDEIEIEQFKRDNSDFFAKMVRKNRVIYDNADDGNRATLEQIQKYLSMKKNINDLANDFPQMYADFSTLVGKFLSQVRDRSGLVASSREARNQKLQLMQELKYEIERLGMDRMKIDLSDYQVIEWLGICTLDFYKDDSGTN